MPGAVRVRGLKEMSRAFARADKHLSRDLRERLRDAAEPVADTAEQLTAYGAPIRNLSPGDRWSQMRVGVTRQLVYVAPKMRGTQTKRMKRRNLKDLLLEKALEPALDRHEDEIVESVDRLLAEVGKDWERG